MVQGQQDGPSTSWNIPRLDIFSVHSIEALFQWVRCWWLVAAERLQISQGRNQQWLIGEILLFDLLPCSSVAGSTTSKKPRGRGFLASFLCCFAPASNNNNSSSTPSSNNIPTTPVQNTVPEENGVIKVSTLIHHGLNMQSQGIEGGREGNSGNCLCMEKHHIFTHDCFCRL